MRTIVEMDMHALCVLVGWADFMFEPGDFMGCVRSDGTVYFMHEEHVIELYRLDPSQLARVVAARSEHPQHTIELRALCKLAGWDDTLPYAGDDEVTVRANGQVVIEHHEHVIELGQLSTAQLAAVNAWF